MKILLVIGKYLPDNRGGMEIYSHSLAKLLLQNGHNVEVAILDRGKTSDYIFEDVHIISLKVDLENFSSFLQQKNYDICHFQEYHGHRGINTAWFTLAKQHCKKVFFTFHLPYLTCYKNDFRYKGLTDCDDFSLPQRCAECIIATKLHYMPGSHLSAYNLGVDLLASVLKKTSKIKKLKGRIQSRRDDLDELIKCCDQIFVYGKWFKELLKKNGYHSATIKLIPHLIKSVSDKTKRDKPGIKNKILFAGRIEEQKGLHLLCEAMNLISNRKIELDVAGNKVDNKYFEDCARKFPFNFLGSLSRDRLLSILKDYDFLILPSVFTEMYSLIIREAFYEQLPVIASAAKGNIDVISEGKSGFIFKYNDPKDLARVINAAYSLKQNGWQPAFEKGDAHQDDLNEIHSYYS